MIKLTYKDFMKIDILLVFLFLLIPMIEYFNYLFRGINTTWILFGLWVGNVFLTSKNLKGFFQILYERKISLALLLIFIWVVAFNYFFVDTNNKSFQYLVTFINFLFIFIIDAYYTLKPAARRYAILYLCLIALGIQAAVSIPYIISSGGIVTRAYSAGLLSAPDQIEAIKNGVGTNGLYSSSIIFLFSYVAMFKNTSYGIFRKILILSAIAILLSCLISSFFLPFLLLITGVFILFLSRFKPNLSRLVKMTLISILFLVALAFAFKHLMVNSHLFRYQMSKIERTFQGDKIEDPTGRTALNRVSMQTFKENPLLGIGVPKWQSYDKIGEHNTWLDYLANFGILGVLPLFFFLIIKFTDRFAVKNDFLAKPIDVIYFRISILLFIVANLVSPLITTPHSYQYLLFLYTSVQLKNSV